MRPDAMEATRSTPAASAPSSPSRRVDGYDLARSLAMLGMMVVHFGLVMAKDPTRPAWAVGVLHALDGRAAATFVILAGVGLTLLSQAAKARSGPDAPALVRKVLIRRGACLLVLGFLNLVVWPGDILRVYGVSLIVAAGLVFASGRWLILAASGFVVGFIALLILCDYETHWDWSTMTYHGLWTPTGAFRNLFFDGFRSVFPWTGLLLFGMWLGRLDLRDRKTNRRVVVVGLIVMVLAGGTSRLWLRSFSAQPRGMDPATIQAFFGTDSMPPLPLFLMSAVGAAVVVIGLSVRAAESRRLAGLLSPLIAVGRMALTWYFLHIFVGLGLVVVSGLATSQPLPIGEATGLGFFALAVGISWLWSRRWPRGPLEGLLRRVAG